jgi:hypothetical protein
MLLNTIQYRLTFLLKDDVMNALPFPYQETSSLIPAHQ